LDSPDLICFVLELNAAWPNTHPLFAFRLQPFAEKFHLQFHKLAGTRERRALNRPHATQAHVNRFEHHNQLLNINVAPNEPARFQCLK
jgi:hypothetical protein